jgi:hypothetical protein
MNSEEWMKVKKNKHPTLLITNLLALCALVIASIPVSAQTGAESTPTPPTLNKLTAASSVYLPFVIRPVCLSVYEITQATQNL